MMTARKSQGALKMPLQKMKSGLSRFRRDTDGSITIEALFWLPLVAISFAITVDLSMMFNANTLAIRVLQDTNRRLAANGIWTEADAEAYVMSRIAATSPNARVTTRVDMTSGLTTTMIVMPTSDIDLFGLVAPLARSEIFVVSQLYIECADPGAETC
ncbi:MAG: hypothetical protein HUJ27_01810 [Rhodobacteraceae bacterium]|nr:hypothetical protein [Paracoccaceae bacterium]